MKNWKGINESTSSGGRRGQKHNVNQVRAVAI
jgi:hypothetical protein